MNIYARCKYKCRLYHRGWAREQKARRIFNKHNVGALNDIVSKCDLIFDRDCRVIIIDAYIHNTYDSDMKGAEDRHRHLIFTLKYELSTLTDDLKRKTRYKLIVMLRDCEIKLNDDGTDYWYPEEPPVVNMEMLRADILAAGKAREKIIADEKHAGEILVNNFAEIGECIKYLGIEMTVVSHLDFYACGYRVTTQPALGCEYVDNDGVIRNKTFTVKEVRALIKQRSYFDDLKHAMLLP